MLIEIKNFKNLKHLSYTIDDNKVNFLFGMSGSGKSSILDAVCGDEPESNKTIGLLDTDQITIEVDGRRISPTETHVFNTEKMNFMSSETNVESFKEVILVNNQEHTNNHARLEGRIANLHNAMQLERQKYEDFDKFLQSIKAKKLTKTNKIPNTSPFAKVVSKVKALSKTKIFNQISSISTQLLDWRIAGVPFISNNNCPFCEKYMGHKLVNKFNRISMFDSRAFGTIKEAMTNSINVLSTSTLNSLSDFQTMEKDIIKISNCVKTYESITLQFYNAFDLSYDYKKFERLKLSNDFRSVFPNTSREYDAVCKNIKSLRNDIKATQETTDGFLKGKKKIINDIFEKMGLPYYFSVKYVRSGPNEYSIVHKKDINNFDDKKRLSEGERALVFLVLFLVSSNSLNSRIFFIDDPVSSYDTYRRKIIFDLILKYLDGKTTVVLSHDTVFAKLALIKMREANNIGTISYLCNNGEDDAIIQRINYVNVESFTSSVARRCNLATNEYEKSILARLLIEEKYKNSPMYTYLSKILHGVPYVDIQRWVLRRSPDEATFLNNLNNELVRYGVPANYLSALTPSYNQNIDISSFSTYEKAIVLREIVNKNQANYSLSIKEELNNNVHICEELAVGIDAFECPIFSRALLDEINRMPTTVSLI